ncbi:hypothetical protein E1301_Tti007684 [Triplophysa tibetana]|uniref:Uncharacterized protein n=1 Tax=Triplophysa tibetana TaxID=1572043 RepID=A0A5A9PAL2_9TELE|nr:hypothetical protein E1301_Tti007684 [Triplophysa tibetana]
MRILRLFLKKGAHMLQCLCGQRSEPTTTTSGETLSCACSPLRDEKRSHWPLALVSTSSVSAVLCAPTPRICANLFARAHATSYDPLMSFHHTFYEMHLYHGHGQNPSPLAAVTV